MHVTAIIPAAGFGKRMGLTQHKQFVTIRGKPILAYTIEKFEQTPAVQDVIVVAPPGWGIYVSDEIIDKFNFRKVRKVVEGGEQRQDSVYNGLQSLDGNIDIVVIHDGVRPLITPQLIESSIQLASQNKTAIVATRVKDTIKEVVGDRIIGTPSRDQLWAVQTPQTFWYSVIKLAYEKAAKEKFYSTDDSALVERLGIPVTILEGDHHNIKITTPEDLKIAELFLNNPV